MITSTRRLRGGRHRLAPRGARGGVGACRAAPGAELTAEELQAHLGERIASSRCRPFWFRADPSQETQPESHQTLLRDERRALWLSEQEPGG